MDIFDVLRELKEKGYLVTKELLKEAVNEQTKNAKDSKSIQTALDKIRKSPSRFFKSASAPARWSSSVPPRVQKYFKELILEGKAGREFLRSYAQQADYKLISSSQIEKAFNKMPAGLYKNYQRCLDKVYYFMLALRSIGGDTDGTPLVLSDLPEDIMFDYTVFLKNTFGDERAKKWINIEHETDMAKLDIYKKHDQKMTDYELKRMTASVLTFGGSDHFVEAMENARHGNKKEAVYHFAAAVVLNVLSAASFASPVPEAKIIADGIIKALKYFARYVPSLSKAADFLLQEVKVTKASGQGYNISLGKGEDSVNLTAIEQEMGKWEIKKWEVTPASSSASLPSHAKDLSKKLGTNLDDISSHLSQPKNSGVKMEDILGIIKNEKTGQYVFLDRQTFLKFKKEVFENHFKKTSAVVDNMEAEKLLKAARDGEQYGNFTKGVNEYGFICNIPKTNNRLFVIIDDSGKITGYRIYILSGRIPRV